MLAKKYRYLLLFLICILSASLWFFHQDRQGEFEWLIEPQFENARDFYSGVAWVQKKQDGAWSQIDKQGNVLIDNFAARSILFYDAKTGLVEFTSTDGFRGCLNLSGDIVISPEYQQMSYLFNGLIGAQKNNLYGVIDTAGKVILPFEYDDYIFVLDSEMFMLNKGEKYAYLNAQGEILTDFIFEHPFVIHWSEGLYPAVLNGQWGLIDREAQWVEPPAYDAIYLPRYGKRDLIGVGKDGKVGFVDINRNTVIDFKFERIGTSSFFYDFSEGLALVVLPEPDTFGNPFGVINEKGEVLFGFSESPTTNYREGFIALIDDNTRKQSLMDRRGKRYVLPEGLEFPSDIGRTSGGTVRVRTNERTNRYEKGLTGYLKAPMQE